MKYRYRVTSGAIDTKGRFTKRPIVEVGLSRGGLQRKFLALIDSGADQITMPSAIADALGVDRSTCPRRSLMGVTMEQIEGFIAHIDIHVDSQVDAINAPVVFIDTEVPVLLGQEAFFDRYRIKFEKDHDTFEITPAPPRRSS